MVGGTCVKHLTVCSQIRHFVMAITNQSRFGDPLAVFRFAPECGQIAAVSGGPTSAKICYGE
jgi:hypothetical protein